MKKLLVLTLALIMILSLAACGGEEVTLVDVTTEQGISLKLPSNMPLQTVNGTTAYINSETGESAVVAVAEVDETPLATWTEEIVLATYQSKYKDAKVESFENGKQINGKESLVTKVTCTSPKGNAITIALVMITDGTNNYVVNFTYGSDDTDGSLATNLQACIDSITIKAA